MSMRSTTEDVFRQLMEESSASPGPFVSSVVDDDDADAKCFITDKEFVYQNNDNDDDDVDHPQQSAATAFALPGRHLATPLGERRETTSRAPKPEEEKAAPPPSDESPPAPEEEKAAPPPSDESPPAPDLFQDMGVLALHIKSVLRENAALKGMQQYLEHLCAAQARELKSIEREEMLEKRRERRKQQRRLKAKSAKFAIKIES